MAGGTGGHIFPALAVAQVFAKRGASIHWLGSVNGMEKTLVARHYPITYLNVRGLRRNGIVAKCFAPIVLLRAIMQAKKLIAAFKPDVVLGMGGFASGPGGVAAWLSNTPLVIHEQNSVAGFTNKLLARVATTVLQAFPKAFHQKIMAQTVGNPVREAIFKPAEKNMHSPTLKILVMGGSQGATAINELMIEMIAKYALTAKSSWQVWHQARPEDCEKIKAVYALHQIEAKVESFIDPVEKAYAWADVVISRAGALTVSEIAAAGLPSILIPFPYAVDNHQYYNGCYLQQAGAAVIYPQSQLDAKTLYEKLSYWSMHRDELLAMGLAARAQAKPDALRQVVEACDRAAENRGNQNGTA